MNFYSPLRYPGGKSRLAKFIGKICVENNINGHYVEPYAGGASVALYLLLENKVSEITINDFDRSIYAFWYSVLNRTDKLCNLITCTDVNVENWKKAKEVQKNKQHISLLKLGFSTLFLNRTNISGILDAGVIGGLSQLGKYKIDCRFNKPYIIDKIRRIAKLREHVTLCNLDAIDLVKDVQKKSQNSQTIFYFDPPYYLKGKSLYINYYDHSDHKMVSEVIRKIKHINWIVSYDNIPQIKEIYKWVRRDRQKTYSLQHTAFKAREGKEILFFSTNLFIPKHISPIVG